MTSYFQCRGGIWCISTRVLADFYQARILAAFSRCHKGIVAYSPYLRPRSEDSTRARPSKRHRSVGSQLLEAIRRSGRTWWPSVTRTRSGFSATGTEAGEPTNSDKSSTGSTERPENHSNLWGFLRFLRSFLGTVNRSRLSGGLAVIRTLRRTFFYREFASTSTLGRLSNSPGNFSNPLQRITQDH
jgi:hypothetical protein